MKIESVHLTGFRNFSDATVNLAEKTLIIGANDVGKTNLLHALRLLLDRSLSEVELDPRESDFHIALDGSQAAELQLEIKLGDVKEDAVISRLKGYVSDARETFLIYRATRADLSWKILIGHSLETCEEVDGRFYLKHIHFKYIESSRDIDQYIQREKRYLLKMAKSKRTPEQEAEDGFKEESLQAELSSINEGINELNYVSGATTSINEELKKISRHHSEYAVDLESQSVNFSSFVERLHLGAKSGGRRVGLGGDGRNNQILVGLWKAKSELEYDSENEALIYCIEEPEAHLHPHQQRKLADYLVRELKGQVLVSTHSPQIASEFLPDGIVRLLEKHGATSAASNGCSSFLDEAWKSMGYRISILPAEAFFADAVLLVEGPSEVQFYQELARQLKIDLDFHNVSILGVDGIAFRVYVKILNVLEIGWALRTDNDVSKVPKSHPVMWSFSGLNRALGILVKKPYKYSLDIDTPQKLAGEWAKISPSLNEKGVFVSKVDLENDLAEVCGNELLEFSKEEDLNAAIVFLQKKKALRMGIFLSLHGNALANLKDDALAKPLHFSVEMSKRRRDEAIA